MLPAAHPASLNDVIRANDLGALSGFEVTKEKSCVIDAAVRMSVAKCVVFTISVEIERRTTAPRNAASPETAILRVTLSRLAIVGFLQCRSWEFSREEEDSTKD